MRQTVLVLNVGSSSVKFALATGRRIIIRGGLDHFGRRANVGVITRREHQTWTAAILNTDQALVFVRRLFTDLKYTPTLIAHRIVHGGRQYQKPTKLTPAVVRALRTLVELAPLHQPANLRGVTFAQRAWPTASEWGMFDTALYRSLPEAVRTYALPQRMAKRFSIEKYGFHGLSHAWAHQKAAKQLVTTPRQLSAVTLHLGSGASMTLWQKGQPIDTTMGFTPLEGLVMATRSGSIDPAIPLYLQKKLGWSAQRTYRLLTEESGLVGLSGLSDMRDILSATGHAVTDWPKRRWDNAERVRASLALAVFLYHIRRTLAGYLGLITGVRAIIFTGPIGANRTVQRLVVQGLPAARGIRPLTIPADEEQYIINAVTK